MNSAPQKYNLRSFSILGVACLLALSTGTPAARARSLADATWGESRSSADGSGGTPSRSIGSTAFVSAGNLYHPVTPEQSAYDWVLDDKRNRIADELRVPAELRARVNFWLRVYTEWSTQQVVLFDSYHPELVYEVLDFRELAATARNAMAYEIMRDRKIKKTLDAYRKAFGKLARADQKNKAAAKRQKKLAKKSAKRSVAKIAPLSREEQIITDTLAKLGGEHQHKLPDYRRHLRTQTGQRDNVIRALVASRPFMQKMEEIFKEYEIPAQVTRLALVESSFTIGAVSKSGAAGVWQFMPASAKEYMLMAPQSQIDERLSPIKSTVAAAQLLRRSYQNFRSWPLAVTSYHHGTTALRSRRSADNSRFSSIAHLFNTCGRKSRGLGWASQNYYAEFLAMTYAEAYRDRFYGEAPDTADHSVQFVRVDGGKTAAKVAMALKVPLYEFQELNPDILNLRTPLPKGFRVAIPGSRSTSEDVALLAKRRPNKKKSG